MTDDFFAGGLLRDTRPKHYSLAFASSIETGSISIPIGRYLTLYNGRKPHLSLDRKTPDQAYPDRVPHTAAA